MFSGFSHEQLELTPLQHTYALSGERLGLASLVGLCGRLKGDSTAHLRETTSRRPAHNAHMTTAVANHLAVRPVLLLRRQPAKAARTRSTQTAWPSLLG